MSMLLTMFVSLWIFNLAPTIQLLLGITTASISLFMYFMKPEMLLEVNKGPSAKVRSPVTVKDSALQYFRTIVAIV